MTDAMPPDPFGAPEEMISMMTGMYKLHSAALAAGFPDIIATQFIAAVFIGLLQASQEPKQAPAQ